MLAFDMINTIAKNVTCECFYSLVLSLLFHCQFNVCHDLICSAGLTKYLSEFMELTLMHIRFYPMEQVRMLSAETLTYLMRTLKKVGKPYLVPKITKVGHVSEKISKGREESLLTE